MFSPLVTTQIMAAWIMIVQQQQQFSSSSFFVVNVRLIDFFSKFKKTSQKCRVFCTKMRTNKRKHLFCPLAVHLEPAQLTLSDKRERCDEQFGGNLQCVCVCVCVFLCVFLPPFLASMSLSRKRFRSRHQGWY